MFKLTRELAERYPDRLIIFDAPPVLATSGAAALAPLVGQVVLVVEAYNTTQENLRAALGALEHVPIAGIVLNKIRHRAVGRAYGSNYGYGYGYGTTEPANSATR
jgi:Mrp family chromosome partitioning ATPase